MSEKNRRETGIASCFSPVTVLFPACYFQQTAPPGFAPNGSDTITIYDEKERRGAGAAVDMIYPKRMWIKRRSEVSTRNRARTFGQRSCHAVLQCNMT